MLKILVKYFILLHKGSYVLKLKSSIILSIIMSGPTFILDKVNHWYLSNQDYIYIVLFAIVVDHILGTFLHLWVKKDFTIKKNIVGIAIKLGLVVGIGVLFEGLRVITKQDNILTEYLILVTRLAVFLYPAGSAFMNSAELTNGKFPPIGFINKIKSFNQDLSIPKKEENNQNQE